MTEHQSSSGNRTEQILGIRFFQGTPSDVVESICAGGGLLVAPSGTCFGRLQEDDQYRDAVTHADYALVDSGLLATLWRLLHRKAITRISGLRYLKTLSVRLRDEASAANTLWIVPHEAGRGALINWLRGRSIDDPLVYVAPRYSRAVADPELLGLVQSHRPAHVIIGIGAGPQEKLGYWLREQLDYRPAIHCIGGALGVLTGDQKPIPDWADRLYLGWCLRLLANPAVFLPRLWRAHQLPGLLIRYGSELPPRVK